MEEAEIHWPSFGVEPYQSEPECSSDEEGTEGKEDTPAAHSPWSLLYIYKITGVFRRYYKDWI